MNADNRREHQRIESLNLLKYAIYDQEDLKIADGMGRTLNIASGGIKIELCSLLEKGKIVNIKLALKEKLITVLGEIVYCKLGENKFYEAGIHFIDVPSDILKLINYYAYEDKSETIIK